MLSSGMFIIFGKLIFDSENACAERQSINRTVLLLSEMCLYNDDIKINGLAFRLAVVA